jgi:ureidoglycolate lyase
MTDIALRAAPTAAEFAPFGELIERPDALGTRRFFSRWLGGAGLQPVFHTNAVAAGALPHAVGMLEKHPHAAQCFVPLDVSRYLVTVAGSDAAGQPLLESLRSFVLPGTQGVIFAPGIWHAPAAVLDRPGNFAVLMWRGQPDDDVFLTIPARRIVAAAGSDRVAAGTDRELA